MPLVTLSVIVSLSLLVALEDRTLIPTGEIVKLFSPYLEKVWELYLAFVCRQSGHQANELIKL